MTVSAGSILNDQSSTQGDDGAYVLVRIFCILRIRPSSPCPRPLIFGLPVLRVQDAYNGVTQENRTHLE